MAKEFSFRGKMLEELKNMDTREFAKLVKSNERRTILRNFDVIEKFVARCRKKETMKKAIKTHNRDIVIVPKMLDMTINIFNGKSFMKIKIIPEMLGHRLGEFAPTRGKVSHGSPGIGATRSSAALSVK
ncbi:30S ribosomal protein S19 [Candidatus Pacearchaeota archaeon]|nr:30S ribosomal protein S19 [Candidatus Pacearchaeota archaeon]